MTTQVRLASVSLVALVLVAAMTSCAPVSSSSSSSSPPSCSQLLDAAVDYSRSGNDDINSVMQALSDRCSDEYEIATSYLAHANDGAFSIDSCDQILGYGTPIESVTLLEQEGWCSFGGSDLASGREWPEGGLGWDEARDHAGTVQRVCGPLASVRETDDGTFVNVGLDYPSVDRFTFIFWDIYLQPIEPDVTVCGSGEIYLYDGVAQVELWDPGTLELWQ